MPELIKQIQMTANFKGLIQLLAKNLYSEPDIFVRELIQNSHDALVRRQDLEKDLEGKIYIQIDDKNRIISFLDNGLGMDQKDIEEFLSVIGSTGTGSARELFKQNKVEFAHKLIGQFGIGVLSAFVVADKIVVRTLKLGEKRAFSWHNSGSSDCDIYEDNRGEVGTTIEIYVSEDYAYMLDEKRIADTIIKYCDYIPFPIFLNGDNQINDINAPWHKKAWLSAAEKEAEYMYLIRRRYGDTPLDVIPFNLDNPFHASGVLFITSRSMFSMKSLGTMDIFVKRMFIKGDDNEFLPDWARFVRGVIDSQDLEPTAARDNIHRNTEAFNYLQGKLGDILIERLLYLAEHEPDKFKRINAWHHYHLKGMAYLSDIFFEKMADNLLFETNRGLLSIKEYLSKTQAMPDKNNRIPIYYFAYTDQATQFYRMANSRNWTVINAGYTYDQDLLELYAKKNAGIVYLERVDTTGDPHFFEELTSDEQEVFQQLEVDIENQLHSRNIKNVSVQTRKIEPKELPSVLIFAPGAEEEESLVSFLAQPWIMESWGDIAREAIKVEELRTIYLFINSNSPLIQDLSSSERQSSSLQEALISVYYIALLNSKNLLTRLKATAIYDQIVKNIHLLVEQEKRLESLSGMIETERLQILEMRQMQQKYSPERPEHIRLFMITPFNEKYKILESVIRKVLECSPYFFEIQLARDYTYKPGLLDNIREHILKSHGFIAEVTEQNPNVMFELGAAMMPDDERPVFTLRSSDAVLDVPADFKEKLFLSYGKLTESSGTLEVNIRAAFERDGRIIHEGILSLLKQRKKRFLSRTLLTNLSRLKLSEKDISLILVNYNSLEDLLSASPDKLSRDLDLEDVAIQMLIGEVRRM